MDIVIELEGGWEDELQQLADALRDESDLGSTRISRPAPEIAPGQLGAETVLQVIGESVLLPILVQALYDHVIRRRRTRSGADLRITITRTDLPDGTRRLEISCDGTASEVMEAAREELE
ncbi:hypothetical protein OG979_17145 [Actinomadura citrea]|uniref:effector-associated constant component EACC1 n=1 Tax=Actinomadura citrea TaxID=46158 RepID=UPI002E2E8149|nr:hypothetical protein [Actinomadura citrea]